MKAVIKRVFLYIIFAVGILGANISVQAAAVTKSTADYTLYSDGRLVIHQNVKYIIDHRGRYWNIEQKKWEIPWSDILEKSEAVFIVGEELGLDEESRDEIYMNPRVTNIVVEDNNYCGIYDLLWCFPNVQSVTYLNSNDFAGSTEYGYGGSDSALRATFFANVWNSLYKNKLAVEVKNNYNSQLNFSPSDDLCILSYDVGDIREKVTNAGFCFKALTCNLDKLQSIVANDSIFYDGKSHAEDIEKEMHIRCENDHGTESYLSHKVLTKGTQYTVSYYNKNTGQEGDTTNAGTIQVTVKGINGHSGTLTGYYTIKQQALKKNNITLSKTSYTYDGKAKKPKVTVKNTAGQTLKEGTDYTVSYSSNKNAGTAVVTVKGKGNYTGTIKKTFKIAKATQSISLKVSKKEYKQKTLAKKSVTFSIGASAKTKLSYKSSKTKYITVTSKGKVTVKKGTPKGTYKITVTAAASSNYKAATKTVKIVVK